MTPLRLAGIAVVLATTIARAQGTAGPSVLAPMPTTAEEPQGYAYNPEGRRDPFVSLQSRGRVVEETASPVSRPPGLAGLATSEVSLRGTIHSRSGYVGIVQGADTKTYIVREGGKLYDGTVRAITTDAMVILQKVDDPLSLEKQREVRKALRTHTPEAK